MSAAPLSIRIGAAPGTPRPVDISSRRPVLAARVLEQRTVDEVRQLIPRLFSVCGFAQHQAACQALKAASSDAADVSKDRERALLVQMESAREHLWRVLVDWPPLVDAEKDREALAKLGRLLPGFQLALAEHTAETWPVVVTAQAAKLEQLLEKFVFAQPPAAWLERQTPLDLENWSAKTATGPARLVERLLQRGWEQVGAINPRFLPPLDPATLNETLAGADADAFVALPRWRGETFETTPLGRCIGEPLVAALVARWGSGLLSRVVALLTELAQMPERLIELAGEDQVRTRGETVAQDTGIAQVEAARGRLVHRVVCHGRRVVRYQILAPTEWNFHPQGALATALTRLPDDEPECLKAQAALLVLVMDPCVGFNVSVH